jgi:hypothetical protein
MMDGFGVFAGAKRASPFTGREKSTRLRESMRVDVGIKRLPSDEL